MNLGENIERLRKLKNISREELAKGLKVTLDDVKALESDSGGSSVAELFKIASCLGTDISALLYGKEFDEKPVQVTTAESRVIVERRQSFDYENLAPYYQGKQFEPFMVDVYPSDNDQQELSQHQGEEFHYVLSGTLKLRIEDKEYVLKEGDSIYFDSSLPHSLSAGARKAKIIVIVHNKESMLTQLRSRQMRNLIQGAKHVGNCSVVLVLPNKHSVEAINTAIGENIISKAYLVGDPIDNSDEYKKYENNYVQIDISKSSEDYEKLAAEKAIELIHQKKAQMLMKGKINTTIFMKAALNKKQGIATSRRLSLVSIFGLPRLDRLVFLTDAGINPTLTNVDDNEMAKDIIHNAIDVAKAMGVSHPKVAILDANEMPSYKIPSSMDAQKLSEMDWDSATVSGPLSYDLALYEESVINKGLVNHPVAGKADVLVVPNITGGNFLYKAWAMTMLAEVGNIVLGAQVPIILTSRNDSEMTKFLTVCASAVYSEYVLNK